MVAEQEDKLARLARERALVERMLAGDERAFQTFNDEFLPGLYRFALARLRHEEDLAREIVQATLCKVIQNLGSFRSESQLLTWLCACCRNEIAAHYRRAASRPREVELDEAATRLDQEAGREPSGPESNLLEKETAAMVHETLDLLTKRYALALEWKYIEGFSVRKIAWRLKLTPKAAESLLTRARSSFREVYPECRESRRDEAREARESTKEVVSR